jgi:hypothetical protein
VFTKNGKLHQGCRTARKLSEQGFDFDNSTRSQQYRQYKEWEKTGDSDLIKAAMHLRLAFGVFHYDGLDYGHANVFLVLAGINNCLDDDEDNGSGDESSDDDEMPCMSNNIYSLLY